MSTSIGLHLEDTGIVTTHAPNGTTGRGWLQLQDSDRSNRSDVGIFPPRDPQLAIAFLHQLAECANELALMIDAGTGT